MMKLLRQRLGKVLMNPDKIIAYITEEEEKDQKL
jgi:hypothetical protein